MRACIHTCTHAYTHIHLYLHTHLHTYTHTDIHTYKHAHIHTFAHTHTHVHAHTLTHIHIAFRNMYLIIELSNDTKVRVVSIPIKGAASVCPYVCMYVCYISHFRNGRGLCEMYVINAYIFE